MLWLIVLASVIGFLSATPIATEPQFANLLPNLSHEVTLLWRLGVGGAVGVGILGFLLNRVQRQIKSRVTNDKPTSLFMQGLLGLGYVGIFLLTLLASLSMGLADFYRYQQTLIRQPVTVNATIRALVISDTISETLQNTDPTTNQVLIGSATSRHVW